MYVNDRYSTHLSIETSKRATFGVCRTQCFESDWLIQQFTHPYFRGGYTRGNNNITAG